MADLPADFWSGWIIVLAVLGFAGLAWLVLSVYFMPAAHEHDEEDLVWDDNLREGNNPAPLWWFWMILAAMVFSVLYLMLYPGLGSYAGAFKWSQGGQYEDHAEDFAEEYAGRRAELLAMSREELAAQPALMDVAQTLFSDNCAACHGTTASGQANLFPNLRNAAWQWGGSAEQIEQTIRNGRTAVMIPWQAVLGDEGVNNVAGFVQTLASGGVDGHAGQAQYLQLCIACHGATGDGNPLLGAPSLRDDEWLYGSDIEQLRTTISAGRNGQMPAFGSRLDDLQIKLLVAWLTQ